METRNPYPTDVSDEEWAFVAPYLTLMTPDALQRTHDQSGCHSGPGRSSNVTVKSQVRELRHRCLPPNPLRCHRTAVAHATRSCCGVSSASSTRCATPTQ